MSVEGNDKVNILKSELKNGLTNRRMYSLWVRDETRGG